MRYRAPFSIIYGVSVNAFINSVAKKSPNIAKIAQLKNDSLKPCEAASSASSKRLAPSLLAIRELIPTPVPTENDIISMLTGNI